MDPTAQTLAMLERVFSSIRVHVAYLDRHFNFLLVNEAYASADNKTPDFFPGRNHFDLYPNPENEAIFRRVVETGERFVVHEKPFIYPDRSRGVTYWDWALEPVKDAAGHVEALVFVLSDVSEKMRTKKALSAALAHTRTLIESSPDGIAILDLSGTITEVNSAAEEMTGYSRLEFIGTRFANYFPEQEKAERGFARVLLEGAIWNYRLLFRHRDGHEFPVVYNSAVYRDSEGNAEGVIFTGRDFTETERNEQERQRLYLELEEKLSESRRQAALMARAEKMGGLGYWRFDFSSRQATWSEQTRRLLGVGPEFPSSLDNLVTFIHPDDRSTFQEARRMAIEIHAPLDVEFRIRRRDDGEERFLNAQGEVEQDATGRPAALFGVVRDVTDRKRQESALEERVKAMAEFLDDVVWIITPGYTQLLYVNRAYERVWGRPRSEVYANPLAYFESLHPEDRERISADLLVMYEAPHQWDGEYRIISPDGKVHWIHDRVFPIFDEKGKLSVIFGVASDVTAIKEAEEKVKKTVSQLEHANRLLEELSYHDPLTGLTNRRFLEQYVGREWSRERRHGHDVSLIMIDLDFFKAYNDAYGHPQGDECLRHVADQLSEQVHRPTDVVARVGGEEFVVLLPETGLADATRLGQRIREAVTRLGIPHQGSRVAPVVTVSVGVATVNPQSAEFDALLNLADQALYRAKSHGRNRVETNTLH